MQLTERYRQSLKWHVTTKKTFLSCGKEMVETVEGRRIDIVARHKIRYENNIVGLCSRGVKMIKKDLLDCAVEVKRVVPSVITTDIVLNEKYCLLFL